jgi:ABC-type antimicrobial peptide transport system permease subunit
MAPLREVVRGLDSNQPVFDVRTMEDLYGMRAHKTPQILFQTVGAMGMMGLVLALVGLYALVSYGVSRRTKEIGIRMAVGAKPASVLRLVLRQGVWLAGCGVLGGIVLSLSMGRVLAGVFPVSHGIDPVTYVMVLPAVLAVTLAAAYIPARRAARVDPLRALRNE